MPCGGQGRGGRCAVLVTNGAVRRRSHLRLTQATWTSGIRSACQTGARRSTQPLLCHLRSKSSGAWSPTALSPMFRCRPPTTSHQEQSPRLFHLQTRTPQLDRSDGRLVPSPAGLCSVKTTVVGPSSRTSPVACELGQTAARGGLACHRTSTGHRGDPGRQLLDVWPPGNEPIDCWVAVDIGTTSNVAYLVDLAERPAFSPGRWTTMARSPGARM